MTPAVPLQRAVFLDRDGTLIGDHGYVHMPGDVALLPGVSVALNRLAHAGWLRIVVTNQSGIGRGLFTTADFDAAELAMRRELAAECASVDATFHCPHAPDAGCLCRKPGTALHREAAAIWNIDLARSWCVGDRPHDVEPAREFGGRGILLGSGVPTAASQLIAPNLASAVDLILRYL